MKKIYMAPTTEEVIIETTMFIAASGDELQLDVPGDDSNLEWGSRISPSELWDD